MINIVPFSRDNLEEVKQLTDEVFGSNYLTIEDLRGGFVNSWRNGENCSFLMYDDGRLIGVRITCAPGRWVYEGYKVDAWKVDPEKVVYFQTICIHPDYSGKGLGQKLLDASIEASKEQDAVAGVANIWVNSPNNSAYRYFSKAGGQVINLKPDFWKYKHTEQVPCSRCGSPCLCTSAEMIIYFEEKL